MNLIKKIQATTSGRYEIRAEGEAAELLIYGDIGESWWDEESNSAQQVIEALNAITAATLTVRINSYGGIVADGIAIYNAIKRHPATVTVEIDGVAFSAASMIAMAGDAVRMAETALLMIHAPWGYAAGNAEEMRRSADTLDRYAAAMANAYVRQGVTYDDALALLQDGEDHYYTAAEAKEQGFIDDINDALPVAAHHDLSRFHNLPAAAAAFHNPEKPAMLVKNPKAAPDKKPAAQTDPVNVPEAAAIEQAQAAERQRIQARNQELKTVFGLPAFKANAAVQAVYQAALEDPDMTIEQARAAALAKLGEGSEPVAGKHSVNITEDEADKRKIAASTLLLARAAVRGQDGKRIQVKANPFRGFTLMDLARDCLARADVDTRGMGKMEVVAAAFTQSGSDFGVLLEEAMHKALLSGYAIAPDTWTRFCATGSVSDFRAHNRYMVGSLGNLDDLSELGEFKTKEIPDGRKESVSIGTKGNLINISRQAIINDDLGAFVGLASALGRAGKRTIESTVYAALASNAGMGPRLNDGKTLFHADHGNIVTPGAPSVGAIEAGVLKMAAQKDVSGSDYLDLSPSIWLGPKSLELTARTLNTDAFDPDAPAKTKNERTSNPYQGYFDDLVASQRLAGVAWYLFADPNDAPVLEVDFLDGEQEPFLDMQEGFSVDGARYKARLDFGVSAVGYEGAVRNAGA